MAVLAVHPLAPRTRGASSPASAPAPVRRQGGVVRPQPQLGSAQRALLVRAAQEGGTRSGRRRRARGIPAGGRSETLGVRPGPCPGGITGAGWRVEVHGVRCQAASDQTQGGGERPEEPRGGWGETGREGGREGGEVESVESVASVGSVEGEVPGDVEEEEEDYPLLDLPWLADGAQAFQASLPTAWGAGDGDGGGGADSSAPQSAADISTDTSSSPFLYGSRLPQILQSGVQEWSGIPGGGEDWGRGGGVPGAYRGFLGGTRARQQALRENVETVLEFVKGARGPLQGVEGEGNPGGVPVASAQGQAVPEEVEWAVVALLQHAEVGSDNAREVAQVALQASEGGVEAFVALGSLVCEQGQWDTQSSWQSLKLVDAVLRTQAQAQEVRLQGEGYGSGIPYKSLALALCARLTELLAPGGHIETRTAQSQSQSHAQTQAAALSLLCTLCRGDDGVVTLLGPHWQALVPPLVSAVADCGVPAAPPSQSQSEEDYFMMLGGGWGTGEPEGGWGGTGAPSGAPEPSERDQDFSAAEGFITAGQTGNADESSSDGWGLGAPHEGPEGVPALDPLVRDSLGESGAGILAVLAGHRRTREGLSEAWEAAIPALASFLLSADAQDTLPPPQVKSLVRTALSSLCSLPSLRLAVLAVGLVPVPLIGAEAYRSFQPLLVTRQAPALHPSIKQPAGPPSSEVASSSESSSSSSSKAGTSTSTTSLGVPVPRARVESLSPIAPTSSGTSAPSSLGSREDGAPGNARGTPGGDARAEEPESTFGARQLLLGLSLAPQAQAQGQPGTSLAPGASSPGVDRSGENPGGSGIGTPGAGAGDAYGVDEAKAREIEGRVRQQFLARIGLLEKSRAQGTPQGEGVQDRGGADAGPGVAAVGVASGGRSAEKESSGTRAGEREGTGTGNDQAAGGGTVTGGDGTGTGGEGRVTEEKVTVMAPWDGVPRLGLILTLEDSTATSRAAEAAAELAEANADAAKALAGSGALQQLWRQLCRASSALQEGSEIGAALDVSGRDSPVRSLTASVSALSRLSSVASAKLGEDIAEAVTVLEQIVVLSSSTPQLIPGDTVQEVQGLLSTLTTQPVTAK